MIIFFWHQIIKDFESGISMVLENVRKNINRYITARGFEWTNQKTLIIGFSETVIGSGKIDHLI